MASDQSSGSQTSRLAYPGQFGLTPSRSEMRPIRELSFDRGTRRATSWRWLISSGPALGN